MPRALPSLGVSPSILFVTATRIGDAVLSTGLLGHLLARYPDARLTIAAGPAAAPLFRAVPNLERLIPLIKRSHARHWLSLYRKVALRRWDLVVDLRGSALAWLLWATVRRTGGKGGFHEHRVIQLGRLFDLAPPPAPLLWTSPAQDRAAAQAIGPGPVLGIAPTANWRGKIWPAERFAELALRLTAPGGVLAGARVAVFAAPHERALALPVLQAIPPGRLIDLTGEPDLLATASSLRRLDLFVGNDTGLMHMAAALGVPTLGLFGPSPAGHYAPWGARSAVAQTDLSYEALVGAADFDHRTTGSLMETLPVERAAAAAAVLLDRVRQAA